MASDPQLPVPAGTTKPTLLEQAIARTKADVDKAATKGAGVQVDLTLDGVEASANADLGKGWTATAFLRKAWDQTKAEVGLRLKKTFGTRR